MNIQDKKHFYLGKHYDLGNDQLIEEPLYYKSKDLTTHGMCVGMTGSGKTGLCIGLLEEAALDGIPMIIIDPKGDLGNMLLTFPDLKAQDFLPWVDEDEADRKGITLETHAQEVANQWTRGLVEWWQHPNRLRQLRDTVDMRIYTPGSQIGIPLTVLNSLNAPPLEVMQDGELFTSKVSNTVSGLLTLAGLQTSTINKKHVFLSTLIGNQWRSGNSVTVPDLVRAVKDAPGSMRMGALPLDDYYPSRQRDKLADRINDIVASPSFSGWLQGQPLSIPHLLGIGGKPQVSIISISHLTDQERMFFVTILLNEVLSWIRTQPGTSNLRALLYMDEVAGYFPPVRNPPSKPPMLTLLKQARAFGLGCMLATQNPVDIDYKGLSNIGTWFIGRLQTERDKAKVMEGLEGAAIQAGQAFNKKRMEATLSALGSRVFLMNNVHSNKPCTFMTRWTMSYLRGPLSREHIKTLMDPFRPPPPPLEVDHISQDQDNTSQESRLQAAQNSLDELELKLFKARKEQANLYAADRPKNLWDWLTRKLF